MSSARSVHWLGLAPPPPLFPPPPPPPPSHVAAVVPAGLACFECTGTSAEIAWPGQTAATWEGGRMGAGQRGAGGRGQASAQNAQNSCGSLRTGNQCWRVPQQALLLA